MILTPQGLFRKKGGSAVVKDATKDDLVRRVQRLEEENFQEPYRSAKLLAKVREAFESPKYLESVPAQCPPGIF
jgi:vacuolar-type H+-ATPase subunit I/STV1